MTQKELEILFKSSAFMDTTPDFDKVWARYVSKKKEGNYMAEKRGGIKILVWVVSFCLLVVLGWFFVSKYSQLARKEKIEKGEAIIVSVVVGDVYAKKLGSDEWKKVNVEEILQMGDYIRTAKDSFCELQMVKRGVFRIEPSSELYLATLVNMDKKIQSKFKLEKGAMGLKPKKIGSGDVFEVHTESAVAAVRGTKFFVSVDETGNTKVTVVEGKVSVKPAITSVEKAVKTGEIDGNVAHVIQEKIVKPVEVGAGEEVDLKKEKVEKVDKAISETIKDLSQGKRKITKEMIESETAVPEIKLENITAKIQEKISTDLGEKGKMKSPEDVMKLVIEKKEVTPEIQKKLELISENKVMEKPETSKIAFKTTPDGAKVYVNGIEMGTTPLEMAFEKGKKLELRIEREGYEIISKEYVVSGNINVEEFLKEKIREVTTSSPSKSSEKEVSSQISSIEKKLPGTIEWEKQIKMNVKYFDHDQVVFKDRIFAVCADRLFIYSLDGKLLKTVVVGDNIQLTRIAIAKDMVIIGSDGKGVYAYSFDGKPIWKNGNVGGQKFGGNPVVYKDKIFVTSFEEGIHILNLKGEISYTIKTPSQIYSSPLIIKGGKQLVYALESGEIVCYDLEKKEKVWSKNYEDRVLYPLVGNDDVAVVFVRNNGFVKAYSTHDGNKKWELSIPRLQKTDLDPIYYNGYVIIGKSEETSMVSIIDAASGKLVNTLKFEERISYPSISQGIMFLGTASGKIYAYDIKSKKYQWVSETGKEGFLSVVVSDEGVFGISKNSMLKIIK